MVRSDHVLKVAGVLDREFQRLAVDFHGDFRSAAACAAALLDFDFIHTRCGHVEFPVGPVVGVRPIAEHVLVGLRLVAQRLAVNACVFGVQADIAGRGRDRRLGVL